MKHYADLASLCLSLLLLTACSAHKGGVVRPGEIPASADGMIKDLKIFPQDLQDYARRAGKDRLVLSAADQAAQDARFNRIFFGPWDMTKATAKKKEILGRFGRGPRGYVRGSQPWSSGDWAAMKANADLGRYPSRATAAIVVRHTNLRELPTSLPRFSEPTPDPVANPFDYFQYSSLPLGTPLFVTHSSRDRGWYFVETPMASGWVRADDVGLVDEDFQRRYRSGRYAAILRDNLTVRTDQGRDVGRVHIGAVFPLVSAVGDQLMVLVPIKNAAGRMDCGVAMFSREEAALKPLPLKAGLLAAVGNQMLGQRYGWGSMLEFRDCSATTRDLFTPFGIWLPRNSRSQARAWDLQSLTGLSGEEKEQAILSDGVPFASLIWLRGHIALYVGKYKGRAAMFHNVWGLRVMEANGEEGRHVIGRCVITSLEPGKELPHLTKVLREHFRGLATLPGAVR